MNDMLDDANNRRGSSDPQGQSDMATAATGAPKVEKPSDLQVRRAVDVLKAVDPERLQGLGWNLVRNHFYEPIVELEACRSRPHTWDTRESLGIDWNVEHQISVAKEVTAYIEELRDIPDHAECRPGGRVEFHWKNNWWTRSDPIVQYGLIRSRRPKRYIEIGCGMSSLVLERALRANDNSDPTRPGGCEVTTIDPSEKPGIWEHLPSGWNLKRGLVQDAPLEMFDELEAGDILFYDGSHCVKTGSDVNWMFFHVLPRLKPGVLFHLHDIFLPRDYPQSWVFDMHKSWNEQYLLQAFLMHNDAWRIEIANAFLGLTKRPAMLELFRGIEDPFGASFWMTKRE